MRWGKAIASSIVLPTNIESYWKQLLGETMPIMQLQDFVGTAAPRSLSQIARHVSSRSMLSQSEVQMDIKCSFERVTQKRQPAVTMRSAEVL